METSKIGNILEKIIRRKIDSLLLCSADLDELLQRLESENYFVKRGKYISVKAPNQQRFIRLKTLGANYSAASIAANFVLFPKSKSVGEIVSETVNKFGFETRKFSFVQSAKDTTAMLENQLNVINEEGLSSIQDVKK